MKFVRLFLHPRGVAWATALLVLFCTAAPSGAFEWLPRAGLRSEIGIAELPPEARETLARIRDGGPHPYRRDGVVFQNREGLLPEQPRGYYREFTVQTPGSRDRGARRIIAGTGRTGDVRTSGEYYYTKDHYRTFRRIRE